jgi:hypothetical protein
MDVEGMAALVHEPVTITTATNHHEFTVDAASTVADRGELLGQASAKGRYECEEA